MDRKQLLIGLAVVAVVALGAAAYFVFWGNSSDTGPLPVGNERFGVQVTASDRTLGSPKAPLLMLEYAAPTCPHCAHFDMEMFPQLKQKYIDTGKVYYVFRVFPLSSADVAAESIARCLPEANYFQFMDLLFRNQTKWDPEYAVQDVHGGLVELGRDAGLSPQQVDTCIANQTQAQRAAQIGQDAQTKYNVSSVPTFFVNGQMHGPFEDFKDVQSFLDPMLAKK